MFHSVNVTLNINKPDLIVMAELSTVIFNRTVLDNAKGQTGADELRVMDKTCETFQNLCNVSSMRKMSNSVERIKYAKNSNPM